MHYIWKNEFKMYTLNCYVLLIYKNYINVFYYNSINCNGIYYFIIIIISYWIGSLTQVIVIFTYLIGSRDLYFGWLPTHLFYKSIGYQNCLKINSTIRQYIKNIKVEKVRDCNIFSDTVPVSLEIINSLIR